VVLAVEAQKLAKSNEDMVGASSLSKFFRVGECDPSPDEKMRGNSSAARKIGRKGFFVTTARRQTADHPPANLGGGFTRLSYSLTVVVFMVQMPTSYEYFSSLFII